MTLDLVGVLGVAYYVGVVLLVLLALLRNRDPAAAIGWSLAIVFLPVAGGILFLLFGLPRVPRRVARKRRQQARFADRLPPDSEPGAAGGFGNLSRIATVLTGLPRREGNAVRLHIDGREAFEAIFEAIDAATEHIHVQMYLFRCDLVGRRLLDALAARAAAGVEIRLLIDAIGSLGAWQSVRHLRRAGGRGAFFGPRYPFGHLFALNFRNHRKLVVCDGRVAFFGGLNVGEEYMGRRGREGADWFDAHLAVRGPVVRDLQRSFLEDWEFATGEDVDEERYLRPAEPAGSAPAQIVVAGPHQEIRAIRQMYIAALTRAEESILLASPYFVPDLGLRDALRVASLRGVAIDILQQGPPPDHWLPYLAAHYSFDELLADNIRLFEFADGMMHAKMLVIDGRWASVGSANFDNRSLWLNFELAGIFDGPDEVDAVRRAFEMARGRSWQVDRQAFRRRGIVARALEESARLLSPLL